MNAIASKIPEPVRQLCATLRQHGKRAWVVGGCVRDMLLDRPIHDFDLCTDALPREVQKIFPKVIPTGIEHGTVTVVVKGVHYEITTLRGETTYSDGRRPDGVEFINDINADLARRDFTVNAIAYDLTTEHLVDPFGGQQDLENRRLRAVGHAHERFAEDGLRVLRAARFVATLEMTLDETTEKAIRPSLDTYRKVSAERIHDEWIKTMKAARPSRAFDVMQRTGILGVSCPEIDATAGLPFGETDAHRDAWAHAQRTLDEVKGDPILKLASLFLHVGRPRTQSAPTGKFSDHERIAADLADTILVRLKFSNEERARIRHVVLHQNPGYASDWTDAQVRRWLRKVGTDRLDDLFTMMRASHRATYASVPREERSGENDTSHDPHLEELVARVKGILDAKHPLTSKSLAINGGDLMRELEWSPGKRIGETLEKLLDLVTESPDLNTREQLLDAARTMTP